MLLRFLVTQAAGSYVKEPWTNAAFSETSPSGLPLLGVGLRSKYGLVSVYAYAVYIEDRAEVHEQVEAAVEESASARLENVAFWDSLVRSDAKKEVVLEMQRTITGDDFKTAFEGSLGSRVSSPEGAESLSSFAGSFQGVSLDSGARVEFHVSEGVITTRLQGETLSVVESRELANALLDVYLGKEPVSTQGKKKFAQDLHLYLERTRKD